MHFDQQNLFSDNQSVVLALAGTALSTNTIDLGETGKNSLGGTQISDPGRAPKADILVQVTETVVGAGASLEAQLVMADDAALTSGLTVIQSSGAVGVANLKAGYQFRLSVPPGITKRYVGLKYVDSGAATTAGKVTAGIVFDKQTNPTV